MLRPSPRHPSIAALALAGCGRVLFDPTGADGATDAASDSAAADGALGDTSTRDAALGDTALGDTALGDTSRADTDVAHDTAVADTGGSTGVRWEITVRNVATAPVPSGYAIRIGLGDFDGISELAPLRVLSDGAPPDDSGLPRALDQAFGAEDRAIWFALEAQLEVGASATYWLYYDREVFTSAPEPEAVFALFDGFGGASVSPTWSTLGAPTFGSALGLPAGGDHAIATDPAADGVGPYAVFEAEVASAGSGAAGVYHWIGFQHVGGFGTGAPFLNWVGRPGVVHPWVDVPAMNHACGDVANDDVLHRYRIERAPGTTTFYRDGVMACAVTVDDATDYAIQLRNQSSATTLAIEWVRVRPLIVPEPEVIIGAAMPIGP